ncbi:MAG: HNH endonuclease, partial [Ferruginibacter sp.]
DLFFDVFCPNITQVTVSFRSGFAGEPEGDLRARIHLRQEYRWRNTRIVSEKKMQALRNGGGRILCECCDFDFLEIYGEIGSGFIECHHKVFLNGGERITELDDLALVCSNCHRILHQKKEDGTYYSIEELRTLIQTGRNKHRL